MTRLWTFLGILAFAGVLATPAQAVPLANPEWITGSDSVAVVSTGTAYIDELFLDAPLGNSLGTILNNITESSESPFGVVDIAAMPLQAETAPAIGEIVALTNLVVSGAPPSGATGVDAAVAAVGGSVIQADAVDEPSSLLMFGFGLVALGFVMKRQGTRRP